MKLFWILSGVAAVLLIAVIAIAYICYRMVFYAPPRDPSEIGKVHVPEGKIYQPYWEKMRKWGAETRALPQEHLSIKSFDGLTLWGTYYEYAPDAPIELMFHGYRGSAQRDLAGGVQRCFKLGHSALLVDQRCSSRSDGSTITFGINEHRDCLSWLELMEEKFGPDAQIILTGISMGAATVMMAAGKPLPKNVIGVLADCGYTSPKEIIRDVMKKSGYPVALVYPFVKLGARLFGSFDLEEFSPVEAMKNCTVPVIFFHGETDDYVPCHMSRVNFDACAAGKKKLVTIPDAGHGLSYPVAPTAYLAAMGEFFHPET